MDGAADATMESELNGYGDTLHFILQFLHTEGFATTEEVLMQEIEKKLPAVIEQTIQKHGGAQLLEEEVQGGASQVTEVGPYLQRCGSSCIAVSATIVLTLVKQRSEFGANVVARA